ncbi:MAG: hypothetical protein ACR2NX_04960 [Chthoniobacterales bacterium]
MKRALVWLILPVVCAWARRQEAMILREGEPLTVEGWENALRVGLRHPERVRTLVVERVPPRFPPWLRMSVNWLGWGPETTAGMALGYGIFLRADQAQRCDLLSHELVHTAQYERLGFRPFLRDYLCECLTAGYPRGELESEARRIASGVGQE